MTAAGEKLTPSHASGGRRRATSMAAATAADSSSEPRPTARASEKCWSGASPSSNRVRCQIDHWLEDRPESPLVDDLHRQGTLSLATCAFFDLGPDQRAGERAQLLEYPQSRLRPDGRPLVARRP